MTLEVYDTLLLGIFLDPALQVLVLQVPLPILKGQAVTVHAHTAREAAVVSALLGLCDPRTGQPRQHKPRCLTSGQVSTGTWNWQGKAHIMAAVPWMTAK
jgi:translation elongation factor EF-1alpha